MSRELLHSEWIMVRAVLSRSLVMLNKAERFHSQLPALGKIPSSYVPTSSLESPYRKAVEFFENHYGDTKPGSVAKLFPQIRRALNSLSRNNTRWVSNEEADKGDRHKRGPAKTAAYVSDTASDRKMYFAERFFYTRPTDVVDALNRTRGKPAKVESRLKLSPDVLSELIIHEAFHLAHRKITGHPGFPHGGGPHNDDKGSKDSKGPFRKIKDRYRLKNAYVFARYVREASAE
ncbi:MAG: hypothetical protein AAF662_11455 [Pseudomonadota bacterium]